ncbi:hypothetical protein EfmJHP36_12310 [Enterococcus faecium]|nr:hypothetical protein EfmJHP36_12310 [Enterococcus faecium]
MRYPKGKIAEDHTPKIKQLHGKSVLMIGASGMIGSFLIDTLMAANEQLGIKIKVYAMGRNRQKLEKGLPVILN